MMLFAYSLLILFSFGMTTSLAYKGPYTFEGHLAKTWDRTSVHLTVHQRERIHRVLSALEGWKRKLTDPEAISYYANTANISQTCSSDARLSVTNFTEWASTMIDASAEIPSGLATFPTHWVGSFDQCMNSPPVKVNQNDSVRSHYCRLVVGVQLPSRPIMLLEIDMCIPSTCSISDVNSYSTAVLRDVTTPSVKLSVVPAQGYCWIPIEDLKFSTAAILMIAVCGITLFLMTCATLYDLFLIFKSKNKHLSRVSCCKSPTVDFQIIQEVNEASGPDEESKTNVFEESDTDETAVPEKKRGTLTKLILAFSVYSNLMKIFDTRQQSGRMNCLDGIRFFSMSWVILGHTLIISAAVSNNIPAIVSLISKRWTFQAIVNATFSVDSFFVLSGLLTSYMFIKAARKRGTVKSGKFWFLYFFHRYWRLTPPYMLCLALYTTLLRYASTGPFWDQTNGIDRALCEQNWWTNILYINNFVHTDKMCMGWSWYLANDMQFSYFVAPIAVTLIFIFGKRGVLFSLSLILASVISTGLISRQNSIGIPDGPNTGFDLIYIKPWCRMGAYVVGIIVGYLIVEHEKKPIKLHLGVVTVGWASAAATCLSVLYGLSWYYYNLGVVTMSLDVSALYYALSRVAWSCGLSWLIFACICGYGGWINRFLSWKVFTPLSRLTYCAYLVQLIVIYVWIMSQTKPVVITTLMFVYWFIGNLFFSYVAALVLSLAWESPFIGLERLLLRK